MGSFDSQLDIPSNVLCVYYNMSSIQLGRKEIRSTKDYYANIDQGPDI